MDSLLFIAFAPTVEGGCIGTFDNPRRESVSPVFRIGELSKHLNENLTVDAVDTVLEPASSASASVSISC